MKSPTSTQKLRGGYYTPSSIAEFLARWSVERASDDVLEPSCGDGAFIEAVGRRKAALGASQLGRIIAVESDHLEARKADKKLSETCQTGAVVAGDFFEYCDRTLLPEGLWQGLAPRFDAVVGNPPFIRYQNFPEPHREIAFRLMRQAGLSPNRLTNAWVAFLVCSALTLKPDGRLAMVVPAELLQVSYAAEVRRFLSEFFQRLTLVTFRSLVFADIQQEVVLLLAERTATESHGVRTVELGGARELRDFDFFESLNAELKPLDHDTEKWTKYFLPKREILLLRRLRQHPNVALLKDVAEVDVGIVTGENSFFILRPSEARTLGVARQSKRVVSRSGQLTGLMFTTQDFRALRSGDSRVLLFAPADVELNALAKPARAYIRWGEKVQKHVGYKCQNRRRWYSVPSTWVPDAFALRQVHRFPKLVMNEAAATCTDTIHRIRFRAGSDAKQIAAAFLNSMTFAFSEVMGRSYGGGVLTFEPSEVEALPIPLYGASEIDPHHVDSLLRANEISSVLNYTDDILLRRHLGLAAGEIKALRGAWLRLSERRMRRRGSSQLSLVAGPTDFEESVEDEAPALVGV